MIWAPPVPSRQLCGADGTLYVNGKAVAKIKSWSFTGQNASASHLINVMQPKTVPLHPPIDKDRPR